MQEMQVGLIAAFAYFCQFVSQLMSLLTWTKIYKNVILFSLAMVKIIYLDNKIIFLIIDKNDAIS